MDSALPELDESGSSLQSRENATLANPNFRFRVRTGCLVCRARKVKCDEQRPGCRNCNKLNRPCVYRATYRRGPSPITRNGLDTSPRHSEPIELPIAEQTPETLLDPRTSESWRGAARVAPRHGDRPAPPDGDASSSDPDEVNGFQQRDGLSIPEHASAAIEKGSQEICFCTTMDWLSTFDALPKSSLTYFIEEVDSPFLSPFDYVSWRRMKIHIAQLSTQDTTVAAALLAVQALYRAQAIRMPMTHAISLYNTATTSFESISTNDTIEFDIILVVAFLLCLCMVTLPNEDNSTVNLLQGTFVNRLETWLLSDCRSPAALRIASWLQMLDVATKRGGSPGLLPTLVSRLLFQHITEVPSIPELDGHRSSHPADALYEVNSAPVFNFYLELQNISNQVAQVSHYNRSRITPSDQAEVTVILTDVKAKMGSLWKSRPGPLQYQPDELREHFSPTISEPLVALTRLCKAAYLAEVVAIGRTLGYPPFASDEAKKALSQIKEIVEDDWVTSNKRGLSSGYLRPLFLYAIESLHRDETQWAVDCLRQIKCPISRSDFVASVAEAIGEAQRDKQRRVTMKYLCYETFGVPVPFM